MEIKIDKNIRRRIIPCNNILCIFCSSTVGICFVAVLTLSGAPPHCCSNFLVFFSSFNSSHTGHLHSAHIEHTDCTDFGDWIERGLFVGVKGSGGVGSGGSLGDGEDSRGVRGRWGLELNGVVGGLLLGKFGCIGVEVEYSQVFAHSHSELSPLTQI